MLQTHEQTVKWQLSKKESLVLMLCGRDDTGKTATTAHTCPAAAASSQLERFLHQSPLKGRVSEGHKTRAATLCSNQAHPCQKVTPWKPFQNDNSQSNAVSLSGKLYSAVKARGRSAGENRGLLCTYNAYVHNNHTKCMEKWFLLSLFQMTQAESLLIAIFKSLQCLSIQLNQIFGLYWYFMHLTLTFWRQCKEPIIFPITDLKLLQELFLLKTLYFVHTSI